MAAINFPTSAVNGTIFYDDFGRKWTYDGSSWSPDNTIPDAGITTTGLVNYSSQTFGGNKTFANDLIINGNLTLTNNPLSVSNGGTGRTTITTNSLLVGNGTSALNFITGNSSNIIVLNASYSPAFVAMSGDVTINEFGTTSIGASRVSNSMLQNSSFVINSTTISLGQTNAIITANTPFNLIRGNGLSYSTGTSFNGSANITVSVDTTVVATLSDSQTLTNKIINGADNTLTVRLNQDTSGTLEVSRGGTGLSNIPSNSILIGNGTSALSTTSGSASQLLLINSSSIPTFTTLSGDVTINSFGTTAIGASKVTNAMLQNSSFEINSTTIALGSTGIIITATTGLNVLSAGTGLQFSTGTNFNGSISRTIRIDSTVATLTGAQTLTNKNISGTSTWTASIIPILYGGTGSNNGSISTTNTLTFSATGTTSNIVLSPGSNGYIDASTKRIKNVFNPIDDQDVATKKYVDDLSTGLVVKDSARVATTADLSATYNNGTSGVGATLTGSATPILIDNVSLSTTNRVLVKNQSNLFENGIYEVTTVGTSSPSTPWVITRTTDADQTADFTEGMFVFVTQGDDNAGTGWVLQTTGTITVGSSDIQFAQFSGNVTYTGVAPIIVDGTNIELDYPLAITYGGTGESTATEAFNSLSPITSLGDLIYGDGTSSATRLAGNISTTIQFLSQVGDGSISAAPAWYTLTKSDVGLDQVENTALSTWPGSTSLVIVGTVTTGVWNGTAIANAYLQNSTISGVSLGSNLFSLSTSSGGGISITGAATSYNGSTSANIVVDTTVVVTLNDSQTLTQKTLTSPVINTATINTSTINSGTTNNVINNTSTLNNSIIGTSGLIFNGVVSGTTRLISSSTPSSNIVTIGTTSGVIVTTGDTATVTNSMLQNSSFVINSTTIALGQTDAIITASTANSLSVGSGLTYAEGTTVSFNGSTARTLSIDSTVVTTTDTQNVSNKTLSTTSIEYSTGLLFEDSTTGTTRLIASTSASNNQIILGTTSGTLVSTGDTATVTNNMLAGSIENAKLVNSSLTINSIAISLGSTATITANTPNALTVSTSSGLSFVSGTNFNGSAARQIAINTSIVAVTTNAITLSNKTIASTGLVFNGSASGTTLVLASSTISPNNTITLSTNTGTILTTGDTGTVTGTIIATSTIVNSNIVDGTIQNSKLANSTISGVALGNNLSSLSAGNGLTGTSYNGGSVSTFQIDTSVVVDVSTAQSVSNKTLSTSTLNSPSIGGHFNLLSTSFTSSTTTPGQAIHSVSASTYRSIKYQVQMTSGASYHFVELVLMHDGSNVLISEYGTIYTSVSLSSFDADISSGNLRLLATPTNAVTTYKIAGTAITV